jgi:PBP1b-binding outer membrane lipoprotein LpoB
VRRLRTAIAIAVALVALALVLAACGGEDDPEASTSPAPPQDVDTATETAPPSAPSAGQLPAEFIDCMAEQGFKIESSADVHSAPAQVLQACFGALHQGGGAP